MNRFEIMMKSLGAHTIRCRQAVFPRYMPLMDRLYPCGELPDSEAELHMMFSLDEKLGAGTIPLSDFVLCYCKL